MGEGGIQIGSERDGVLGQDGCEDRRGSIGSWSGHACS